MSTEVGSHGSMVCAPLPSAPAPRPGAAVVGRPLTFFCFSARSAVSVKRVPDEVRESGVLPALGNLSSEVSRLLPRSIPSLPPRGFALSPFPSPSLCLSVAHTLLLYLSPSLLLSVSFSLSLFICFMSIALYFYRSAVQLSLCLSLFLSL